MEKMITTLKKKKKKKRKRVREERQTETGNIETEQELGK